MKIFKEGVDPQKPDLTIPADKLVTKDALAVCRLLAINPDDILTRQVEDFATPGEKKLSDQRLQLRYQYYEEKRVMKLKAIENILMKCSANTKQGNPTTEAHQMLSLLKDIKHAPVHRSALSHNLRSSNDMQTNSPGRWTFFDKNPHSLGGPKPF